MYNDFNILKTIEKGKHPLYLRIFLTVFFFFDLYLRKQIAGELKELLPINFSYKTKIFQNKCLTKKHAYEIDTS